MTHYFSSRPTRFRLRFDNEEVALVNGVTLIGREPGCLIALLDSMVSRRHARIQCDGDTAVIEDLSSRNGTWVNGILISGPHSLRDGDRIGIGSHMIVVGLADAGAWELTDSATGLIQVCPMCRNPSGADACVVCGWTKTSAQVPPSRVEETAQARWSLGILLEMLGKAMLTQRARDAERVMREVAIVVEDQVRLGKALDTEERRALSEATAWLSDAQQSNSWSEWMRSLPQEPGMTIPPPVN